MQPKFQFKILVCFFICFVCLYKLKAQIVAGDVPLGYQLVEDSMVVIWPGCNGPAYKMYLNLDCDTDMDIKMQAVSYCDPPNSNWRLYWEVYILDSSFQIAETNMIMTFPELVCTHVNSGVLIEQGGNPTNPGGLVWNPRVGLNVNANGPSFYYPYPFPSLSYDGYLPIRKKINGEYLYGWIHLSTSNPINYYTDKIYSHTKLPLYSVIRDTINCHDSYTFIDGLTLNNLIRDTTRDVLLTSASGCDSLVRTSLKVPSDFIGNNDDTSSSGQSVVFIDGTSFTYPLAGIFTHNNHFVSVNGCDSLIVTHIYIYEALNYSSSYNVFTRCHGTTVGFNPHHSGGKPPISYLWAPISGVGATFNTELIQFVADTSITYVLTAIDSLGSIAKDTFQLIVDTPLVMHPITSQFPTFCKDSMLLYSNSTGNIQWQKYNASTNTWVNVTSSASTENLFIHTHGTYRYINSNSCGSVTNSISIQPNLLHPLAYSSMDTICPGQFVTLWGGGGVNYTWSGGVLNNIPIVPGYSSTYTVTATDINGCTNTATKFIYIDAVPHLNFIDATPSIICSSDHSTLALNYNHTYCVPSWSWYTHNGYIPRFDFSTTSPWGPTMMSHSSGDDAYSYYSSWMPNVTAGMNCHFEIYMSTMLPYPANYYRTLWIDYNADGDFSDNGELVIYNYSNAYSYSGDIVIPLNAYNGITRMRVGLSSENYNSVCYSGGYGEYEDYPINISGGYNNITWMPSTLLNTSVGQSVTTKSLLDSTVFTAYFTNASGCVDSVSKLISVKPSLNDTTHIDICPNQLPYNWRGQNYSLSGNYTMSYTNSFDCDSLYTLQLSVHDTNTSVSNQSICSNQLPYSWNGLNINSNGVYMVSLLNSFGCDSIASLNLTIHPTSASISNAAVCSNQLPYSWNGQNYSSSGVYNLSYSNSFGCDSIASLNLTIHDTSVSSTNATICSNEMPFVWNGQSFITSGVYASNFINSTGCDSIARLNLTIHPTSTSTSNATFCSNQFPFSWNGININSAGVYSATLTNLYGCDSIATLNLFVVDTILNAFNLTICSYELPYHWNEHNLTSAGIYHSNFINNVGCDSIEILNLNVVNDSVEIYQTGNLLIANQASYTYQWFDVNNHHIIPGATNSTFIANQTGSYSVIISNGFCVDTSTLIQVQSLSFNNNSNECNFRAYPSPVSKTLFVNYGGPENTTATLELYDDAGRLILEQLLEARQLTSIDIANLPRGVYYVRCDSCVRKIVKE